MEYYYWFIVALLLVAFEIITPGFVILWFGISAGIVALLDLLGLNNLAIQVVIFVVLSLIMVILSRTFFKKTFTHAPGKTLRTNADVLIDKTASVVLEINNSIGQGRVNIDGIDWAARSENGEIIPAGTIVKVVRYEGVKVFVIPIE